MNELYGVASALRRMAAEAAAHRVRVSLIKLEKKYRLDQARWPKGTRTNGKVGGGRFSSEGSGAASRTIEGTARRAAANLAIRAAIANPEVAIASAAGVGTLAGSTQIAVTRAAGWNARTAGGGATPFLGQPLSLLSEASAGGKTPTYAARQSLWGQACDELQEEDEAVCRKLSGRAAALCWASANTRYSECITRGPQGVTTRLSRGR